ncbi:hypothetical protein K0A97_00070 [Patescibacteria group bacterium]|nr:hypothetical protein [Patescibacteria group bacterium]
MGNRDNSILLKKEKKKNLPKGQLNSGTSSSTDSIGTNSKKKDDLIYIPFLLIILLIITFLVLNLPFEKKYEEMPKCGDGTFYGSCSLDKPYYCDKGILVEKASFCGCPEEGQILFYKNGDFCKSTYNREFLEMSLPYFLRGELKEIKFNLSEKSFDYISEIPRTISHLSNSFPLRYDFKNKAINEPFQRELILPLIKEIQNIAPKNKEEQLRIAVSLVQNIPYESSNKTYFFGMNEINHSRYPYEVLYENQGICGEKSQLMVLLLKELGYGTAIFYFKEENHEAVGIKCPIERSLYGSGYCFVETGGPSIITDSNLIFLGGVRLVSIPEVIITSQGISLSSDLYEYKDAKTLNNIREKNLVGFFNLWRLPKINERYNLLETPKIYL